MPTAASPEVGRASSPLGRSAARSGLLPAGGSGSVPDTSSAGDILSSAGGTGRSPGGSSGCLSSPSEPALSGVALVTKSLPNSSSAELSVIVLTEIGICLPTSGVTRPISVDRSFTTTISPSTRTIGGSGLPPNRSLRSGPQILRCATSSCSTPQRFVAALTRTSFSISDRGAANGPAPLTALANTAAVCSI